MTVRRAVAVATMLALVASGCASIKSARDRIVRAPARCADETVQIYFEPESAEVTKEGRAVLMAAAAQSRPCKVASVDVLGLADAAGAPAPNLELSRRRAQSVTAALTAAGLPAGEFRVGAAGQAGAVTAEGQSRPLRRRVDVVLHLQKG